MGEQSRRTDSDCPGGERVWREDRGLIASVRRTDEGYVVARAYIARPGVMEYRQADGGIIRELVLPEELHDPASIDTLRGKPTTLEHPPEDVTPANVSKYGTGDVDNEVRVNDEGYLDVELRLRRQDAIAAYDDGTKVELSPGYWVRSEDSPGTHPQYGPYDRVQRSRRYNHVAQVERARGGPDLRIPRADSAGAAVMVKRLDAPDPNHGKRADDQPPERHVKGKALLTFMMTLLGGGQSRQDAIDCAVGFGAERADAEQAASMAAEGGKHDEGIKMLSDKIDKLTDALTKAFGKKDMEGEEDEPEGEPKGDTADRQAWYTERKKLDAAAQQYGLDAKEVAKLDNSSLRKAIVLKASPEARKDAEDAYYQARFDVLSEQAQSPQSPNAFPGHQPTPDPWQGMGFKGDGQKPGTRQDGDDAQPLPARAFLNNINSQRG